MMDAQVKKLARGYGQTLHDAEDAQDNHAIIKSSDEWDAFYDSLPPKQQKIAGFAHRDTHYAK